MPPVTHELPPLPQPAVAPDITETTPPPREAFVLAWSQQGKPFHKGIAVDRQGRVAVASAKHVALYDKRGKLLAAHDVCTPVAAPAFSGDTVAVLCVDRIARFALPQLSELPHTTLPGAATAWALADERAAIAFNKGPVRILKGGVLESEIDINDDATALALDGQNVAIGLAGGDVIVRAIDGGTAQRVKVKPFMAVDALSLSPNGTMLFAGAGPMAAVWWLASLQAESARFTGVGGITAAAWVNDSEIATVGRDGMLLLDVKHRRSGSIGGVGAGQIPNDLSAMGARVCAADEMGFVSCFVRGQGAAGGAVPMTNPGGAGTRMMGGSLAHYGGRKLQVRPLRRMPLPTKGQPVIVLRYEEMRVTGALSARWIEVADAKVERLDEDLVYLTVDGSLRNTDGEADPLPFGTAVKLVWHP